MVYPFLSFRVFKCGLGLQLLERQVLTASMCLDYECRSFVVYEHFTHFLHTLYVCSGTEILYRSHLQSKSHLTGATSCCTLGLAECLRLAAHT